MIKQIFSRGMIAGVFLPLAIAVTLIYGCGTSRPPGGEGSSGQPPVVGESCTAGQTRACKKMLSIQNGILSCFSGTQNCGAGGRWEACGTGEGSIEATNVGLQIPDMIDPTEEDIKTRTHLTQGDAAAAACANLCNPGCLGYDEDAGPLTVDAAQLLDVAVPNALVPPGQRSDVYHDKTYWGTDCERWNTGNAATAQASASCHVDSYCVKHNGQPGERNCNPFQDGETHASKLVGGGAISCRDNFPDLTIGLPCEATTASPSFNAIPVCNRGTAPVPAGQTITVHLGNSALLPGQHTPLAAADAGPDGSPGSGMAACYTNTTDCSITLTNPLAPGSCIRFSDLVACGSKTTGTKALYVNANRSIQECTFRTHIDGYTPSTHAFGGEQVDQYGCQNNWATFNASQAPICPLTAVPKIVTLNYSGVCPPGTKVKWGTLAWNASTPGLTVVDRSEIIFEVSTAPRYPDGGIGTYSPFVQIARARLPYNVLNDADPAVCNMNGTCSPAGCTASLCPRGFSTIIGGAANNEELRLRITLNPNLTNLPILYNYFLNYTCADAE